MEGGSSPAKSGDQSMVIDLTDVIDDKGDSMLNAQDITPGDESITGKPLV